MKRDDISFFEEIADDFFAECEELLADIRRNLLYIDELKGSSIPARTVMEELLRSFHTLKGLTGMIGARNIVNLTHSLETFLKVAYESHLLITPDKLDVLFNGVKNIEHMLEAFRNKTDTGDVSDVVRDIENLVPPELDAEIREKTQDSAEGNNTHHNEIVWRFRFTPSKELYEKGVNINTVRQRMTSLGKVQSSRPTALPDGRITFEFLVLTGKDENEFSKWIDDGIVYEKIEESSVKPEEKAGSDRSFIQKNVVRVELSRLDEIMRTVADLVISRARLNDHLKTSEESFAENRNELKEISMLIDRQLKDLRTGLMKLRLVPVGEAFERLRFIVRDLIRENGKPVILETSGEETHIDKFVMEKMFDPLLHIVRNAVSHGIESPEDRRKSGKPEEGRLWLRASASGDTVIFEVEDDGSGIDRRRIEEKAVSAGLIEPGTYIDDNSFLEIMGTPGFTTREETDILSGRGVGMNVALRTINELGGSLSFESENGSGTRFTIRLPLTLLIVDALIVKVGDYVFAVPLPSVNEVVQFTDKELVRMENNEMLPNRDIVMPLIRLNSFFHISSSQSQVRNAIVVGHGKDIVGITVDKILGQREIVVRSLPDPLVRVDGISGATELGEGRVVLIIDPKSLIRSASVKKQKAYV